MDLSKLPDAQRQELEQLQQQFQEHQAQQQKQQEESAAAAAAATASASAAAAAAASASAAPQPPPPAYDPSQVNQAYDPSQAYDQSYYYNYNYQDLAQQQPHHQHYDASYYQHYYPNAYQQPQQYAPPETSAAPAYMVPNEQQPVEASGSGPLGLGQAQAQAPYVDPSNQVNVPPNPGYPVPPGLNAAAAAAVAALSQLTQFAGTMGAAERAMGGGYGPPMAGGEHYGHGHFGPPVGHFPFRGGGRRGGAPFRGGGGRGNFGFRPPNPGGSGPPFRGRGGRGRGGRGGRHNPSFGRPSFLPEPFAMQESKPLEGPEPSAPVRVAWCELCRVDCNSNEILEQHKNGKRHKKNQQKLQEMKTEYQPVPEPEKDEKPVSETNKPEPENEVKVSVEETKVETEANDNQENKAWTKRKSRGGGRGGGRGAKRQRQAATGPPRPKVVIPLMCDLCNVKCDTQEVFDRHVAGKKHIAKVKRFEGHQAMYGATAVQALYPPNPLSQTLGGPQPAYYGAPGSYPAPPETAFIPPPPPNQIQNPNPQLADAPLEFTTQSAAPEPQVAPVTAPETNAGNGV